MSNEGTGLRPNQQVVKLGDPNCYIFMNIDMTGYNRKTTLISLALVDNNGRSFLGEFNDFSEKQFEQLSEEDKSAIEMITGRKCYNNDDLEDILFSEEEKANILRDETPEELRILKDEEDEKDGFAQISSDKEMKRIMKANPEFVLFIKDVIKKENRVGEHLQKYIYDLTSSDIDEITNL